MPDDVKPVDALDLSGLLDATEADIQKEAEQKARTKIRYVYDQISAFKAQIKKNEAEAVKLKDRLAKAEGKIQALREGKMEVLNSIDASKPLNIYDDTKD